MGPPLVIRKCLGRGQEEIAGVTAIPRLHHYVEVLLVGVLVVLLQAANRIRAKTALDSLGSVALRRVSATLVVCQSHHRRQIEGTNLQEGISCSVFKVNKIYTC